MGIFNSGPSLGSVVAPPLIVWLQIRFGWQATFLVTGSLGFLWMIAWLLIYRPMAQHPWITPAEHQLIVTGQHDPSLGAQQRWGWADVIKYRQTWSIILSRMLVDPVWWLYIIWLPEYLNKARGMDLKQIGMFAWVPFLSADAGSLLGGFLSGHLIRRGFSTSAARKTVIIVAAMLMLACIPAARAKGAGEALLWISIVTFAFQAWINNVQTLPSDLFPQQAVASVAGLGGVGAGIGAIIFTLTTGWVVDHYSYTPILMIAGLLAPAGTIVLLALLGRVRPLSQDSAAFPNSVSAV